MLNSSGGTYPISMADKDANAPIEATNQIPLCGFGILYKRGTWGCVYLSRIALTNIKRYITRYICAEITVRIQYAALAEGI